MFHSASSDVSGSPSWCLCSPVTIGDVGYFLLFMSVTSSTAEEQILSVKQLNHFRDAKCLSFTG